MIRTYDQKFLTLLLSAPATIIPAGPPPIIQTFSISQLNLNEKYLLAFKLKIFTSQIFKLKSRHLFPDTTNRNFHIKIFTVTESGDQIN